MNNLEVCCHLLEKVHLLIHQLMNMKEQVKFKAFKDFL